MTNYQLVAAHKGKILIAKPKHPYSIWQTNFKGLMLTAPAVRELVSKASPKLSPNGLYFVDHTNFEKGQIEFFDFNSRKRTVICNVAKPGAGLALAPDGRSPVYSQNESEDYNIMLVKKFR